MVPKLALAILLLPACAEPAKGKRHPDPTAEQPDPTAPDTSITSPCTCSTPWPGYVHVVSGAVLRAETPVVVADAPIAVAGFGDDEIGARIKSLGDLDGDGLDEVYIAGWSGYGWGFRGADLALGVDVGASLFELSIRQGHTGALDADPIPDLDGDGLDELLSEGTEWDGFATLFTGERLLIGGSLLAQDAAVALDDGPGSGPTRPIGDIDGDGLPEIAVHADDGSVDTVLSGATWLAPDADPLAQPLGTIDLDADQGIEGTADLDGDGRADIVAWSEKGNLSAVYAYPGATLAPGLLRTDALWTLDGTQGTGAFTRGCPVGDVDGDGRDDVYVHSWTGGYLAFRGGVFTGASIAAGGTVTIDDADLGPWDAGWEYASCQDLDGDGRNDVVGYVGFDRLTVIFAADLGPGFAGAPLEVPGLGRRELVAVSDLDGDAIPDLLVAE